MVTAYARNQLFKVNNKEMMQEEYQERICFQIENLYKAYTHREKNVGYFFLSVRIQLILTCTYFKNYCQTVMSRGTPSTSPIVDLSEPILSLMTFEQSPP